MARYGNIMPVFNGTEAKKETVRALLRNNGADFEEVENVFYIETNSKQNTADIITSLKATDVEFIFFHNGNSDGSVIRTGRMSDELMNRIDRILFQ